MRTEPAAPLPAHKRAILHAYRDQFKDAPVVSKPRSLSFETAQRMRALWLQGTSSTELARRYLNGRVDTCLGILYGLSYTTPGKEELATFGELVRGLYAAIDATEFPPLDASLTTCDSWALRAYVEGKVVKAEPAPLVVKHPEPEKAAVPAKPKQEVKVRHIPVTNGRKIRCAERAYPPGTRGVLADDEAFEPEQGDELNPWGVAHREIHERKRTPDGAEVSVCRCPRCNGTMIAGWMSLERGVEKTKQVWAECACGWEGVLADALAMGDL